MNMNDLLHRWYFAAFKSSFLQPRPYFSFLPLQIALVEPSKNFWLLSLSGNIVVTKQTMYLSSRIIETIH